MNHSPSLKSVVKQFTSWREASGKGKQTPPPLKQQAIALTYKNQLKIGYNCKYLK
jgi:hypothetical protein